MPWAETHKSRLGWKKMEDEMGWGRCRRTRGTIFPSQIWNTEKACMCANTCQSFIPGWNMCVRQRALRQLLVRLPLLPDAVIRFALLCAQRKGSEYSYPVANS